MSRKTKRTQRQIEAARKNGARSKGPVTPEGKAKSSRNALKHGVYADAFCLVTESLELFEDFRQQCFDELQPVGILEFDYVEDYIACRWRIRRVRVAESALLNMQMQAREPQAQAACDGPLHNDDLTAIGYRDLTDHSNALANYRRLESSLARQADHALRRLRELQAERFELEATEDEPSSAPKLPDVCRIEPGGAQPISNQPVPEEPTPPLPVAA